jgi:hypothetical protein
MLRRLLAVYMTLVLVAGPSLCCCTIVSAAAPPPAATPESSSPDPAIPCCCKHPRPADVGQHLGKSGGAAGHHQPPSKPGKHQCPCKDKGGKPTLDSNPTASATAQDALRLLTPAFQYVLETFTSDLSADSTLDSGVLSPSGQRLTSWRLLNAPHLLRC